MDISELFTEDSNVKGTTRGHTLTLEKPGCIRDSGNYFFSHRVGLVGRWKSLDQEMVDAPSVNAFKGRLDSKTNKGGLFMD